MFIKLFIALTACAIYTLAIREKVATRGLKQISRREVVERMTRVRSAKRAGTSPVAPLNPVTAQSNQDQFRLYHSGSGFIENEDNQGADFFNYNPAFNTVIPSGTSQNDAIQLCANDNRNYDSFQIYYLTDTEQWTCRHYVNQNTDEAAFDVATPNANPVYGYNIVPIFG